MEFGFLVKPYLENFHNCQISENNQCNINNVVDDQGEINGFVTPSSGESKIPATLKCPPAPKKLKTVASSPAKRKAMLGQRILLDLSKEIESLFPPELLADLGNKIKKVRQLS